MSKNRLTHWHVIALISFDGQMEEYEFNMLYDDSDLERSEKEAKKLIERLPCKPVVHTLQLTNDPYFVLTDSAISQIKLGRTEGSHIGYFHLPKPENLN